MSLPLLYWILMLLWLIFSLYVGYVPGQPYSWRLGVNGLLLFILFLILGWHDFGSPVKP